MWYDTLACVLWACIHRQCYISPANDLVTSHKKEFVVSMYNYCTLDQDDLVDFGDPTLPHHSLCSHHPQYAFHKATTSHKHAAAFQLYDARQDGCLSAEDVSVMLLEVRLTAHLFGYDAHVMSASGRRTAPQRTWTESCKTSRTRSKTNPGKYFQ